MNKLHYNKTHQDYCLDLNATVADVKLLFQRQDAPIALITQNKNTLVGIVCEADIPDSHNNLLQNINQLPVAQIMNSRFTSATNEMNDEEIIALMLSKSTAHMPIKDNDNTVIALATLDRLHDDKSNAFSHTINKIDQQHIINALAVLSSNVEPTKIHQQLQQLPWLPLDHLYRQTKRVLNNNEQWRYGAKRTLNWIDKCYSPFREAYSIVGTTFCDLGCGIFNALAVGVFMYLNGAESFYATDIAPADQERAAEALAEMLLNCLIEPEKWHQSDISRDTFNARIKQFDIRALNSGNLEKGLGEFAKHYLVENFYHSSIPANSVDRMTSIAVLEHFDDIKQACHKMFEITKPGGYLFHDIDLRDHRWWHKPEIYTPWSFLLTEQPRKNEICNRLRASDFIKYFEKVGFQVVDIKQLREPVPDYIKQNLADCFEHYSDDDLETIQLKCLLQKPA